MGKEVVKELIQAELNVKNLTKELQRLISDEKYREQMKDEFTTLKDRLGGLGASGRCAKHLLKSMDS